MQITGNNKKICFSSIHKALNILAVYVNQSIKIPLSFKWMCIIKPSNPLVCKNIAKDKLYQTIISRYRSIQSNWLRVKGNAIKIIIACNVKVNISG